MTKLEQRSKQIAFQRFW